MQPTTARRSRPAAALGATLAALTALGALLLGTAGPAAAHSTLTGSSPADGAVVDHAPDSVTLTFSGGVRLSDDSFRVLGPDGSRADTGEQLDLCSDDTIRYGTPLRAALPDGTYTVAWKVVSADGHPVSGAFTFSLGAPSGTTVAIPQQETGGGTTGLLHDLARYTAYGGFVVLVGATTLLLGCWPGGTRNRAVRRLVRASWVALTAATLARLLLRHPYTTSGDLSDALDLGGLGATVNTTVGAALVCRLLLLAATAFFLVLLFVRDAAADGGAADDGASRAPARHRAHTAFAGCGAALAAALAATWALAEHATTGLQTALAQPSHLAHLTAVAVWLGGLTTLVAALTHPGDRPVPPAAVHRFSRLAVTAVAVLAATGVYQSWRQVGTLSALTGTTYGRLLLVKTALVAVLITLGWFSRRWTGRLAATPTGPAATAGAALSRTGARTAVPDGATSSPAATPRLTEGPQNVDAPVRTADPPAGDDPPPTDDPVRAAQLARQRAAVQQARRRRARDADPRRVGLRRSVLAEALVGAAVLAVTVQLTGTEPARRAEAAAPITGPSTAVPDRPIDLRLPFDTGGPHGKGTAALTLDPGRTGRNTLRIATTAPDGEPMDLPELRLALTLPARDLGPLRFTPDRTAEGRWHARKVVLPAPGDWEIALTLRTSQIDQVTRTETVTIGGQERRLAS